MHLYEDLISIDRSPKLIDAVVNRKDRVLNVQNKRHGVSARRGDGTFGELIPGETALTDPGSGPRTDSYSRDRRRSEDTGKGDD